jgi:hypothetical protein
MFSIRSRSLSLLLISSSLSLGCGAASSSAKPAASAESAAGPAATPAPSQTATTPSAPSAAQLWTAVENPNARYLAALGEATAQDDSVTQQHLAYARMHAARTLQSYPDLELAAPTFDRDALVAESQRRKLLGVVLQCGVTLHDVDERGTHFAVNVAVIDLRSEDIVATLSGRATAPGPTSEEAEQLALEGALNSAMNGVPQLLASLAASTN